MNQEEHYLQKAIRLALANMKQGGRPFGAIVVKDGETVATGVNEIVATHDPTAHAELLALRAAGQRLGNPDLTGCTVYASGQPCPMCMAAMRLAGVGTVIYAYSNDDAAPYGLSTAAIGEELALPFSEQSMTIRYHPVRLDEVDLYRAWTTKQ